MKDKFIRKFMRIAREVGTYENPCYSRKIGVVIVDPDNYRILGTGYNGPPPGTPHCDTEEYLREFFWPQLTEPEKESIYFAYDSDEEFIKAHTNCGTCPRRLVGAHSGERSELCSCGHAERHAITNAGCDLLGAVMCCWCGVPCLQCADAIIQSGIKKVYCLKWPVDYQTQARWLFAQAEVEIIEFEESYFDT